MCIAFVGQKMELPADGLLPHAFGGASEAAALLTHPWRGGDICTVSAGAADGDCVPRIWFLVQPCLSREGGTGEGKGGAV